MAKKKKSKKKSSSSSNSALVQMQNLANQTQIKLQEMVNSANELQTKYNTEEAQKARDWQADMSKSSHQMEVEDLKKAGLNPVLSSGGSGAQSYTTSSASAQPESGASALANVQSSQLGAIGSMESSRIQAAATRAAAAQSAAAMRAAAAQSAAAKKYAADVGYAKAKYQADIQRKNVKDTLKTQKWMSQFKQASSSFGLIDKYVTKVFNALPANVDSSKYVKLAKNFNNKFVNDPSKYLKTGSSATKNNFKLTTAGVQASNGILKQMNIKQTKANRRLAVKAYVYGDKSAINSLYNLVPKSYNSTTVRPGWR